MRRRCWAAMTPGGRCTQWSQKAAAYLGLSRIVRPPLQDTKTLGAHDGVRRKARITFVQDFNRTMGPNSISVICSCASYDKLSVLDKFPLVSDLSERSRTID
jgi:hypothetical protein